jgi:hypothetical protein
MVGYLKVTLAILTMVVPLNQCVSNQVDHAPDQQCLSWPSGSLTVDSTLVTGGNLLYLLHSTDQFWQPAPPSPNATPAPSTVTQNLLQFYSDYGDADDNFNQKVYGYLSSQTTADGSPLVSPGEFAFSAPLVFHNEDAVGVSYYTATFSGTTNFAYGPVVYIPQFPGATGENPGCLALVNLPSASPSPSPTASASASPTVSPTASPSPAPTSSPSPAPTSTPTGQSTPQATISANVTFNTGGSILASGIGTLPIPPAGLGYSYANFGLQGVNSAESGTLTVAAGSSNFSNATFGSPTGLTPLEFVAMQFTQPLAFKTTTSPTFDLCFPSSLASASSYSFGFYNGGALVSTQAATLTTNDATCAGATNVHLSAMSGFGGQSITANTGFGIIISTP